MRILAAGGLYHITARATGRDYLFTEDRERRFFLRLLGDVVNRFRWRCLEYCVLGTHYHLLLETPDANLDRGMQRLNGLYGQWFNREHTRRGHLFGDRYGSTVVKRQPHAVEIVRYIAQNPVRAGLCARPEAWPWSSYVATVGLAVRPSFLDDEELVSWFAPRRGAGIRRLREFVDDS